MLLKNAVISALLTLISLTTHAQKISKAEALADLNQLESSFRTYHSGLTRYTPMDSIKYYFDKVRSEMGDMEEAEFFGKVTYLLNKVRCGHTRSSMPQSVNQSFKASRKFMPISVKFLGDHLFVSDMVGSTGLEKGDQILNINGLNMAQIKKRIFEHHSSDGYINTSKHRLTERYFRYYYQLYIDPDAEVYNMNVNRGEQTMRVSVEGKDWDNISALDTPLPEQAVLTLSHGKEYSYMRIGTFVNYYMRQEDLDYETFLESSFQDLKEREVKDLVLDLRGNGGGDDNYGALLVSYFAKKNFRYFDRIEVTDDYEGYGNVAKRNGMNLMTSHKGLSTWEPQENRFEGNVYVLTDGWSFSTCADVATVLHHNQWATFIGEETGGGYDGNTSGNSRTLSLSNSGIRVNLPMWKYTTANLGHDYPGRGVIPDYPVVQTLNEFLSGKDAVLNKAIDLIEHR
ncbi:hypothetical protein BFP97_07440 [Roseivirga sp. 4D4]|uniref:S41 family peptidase n=1 Tax=Roseivirga sp. 4D4 TaxID=1889784 RepID=UPI000853C0E9|nr:S41 family peptidase [Roseivirga sp. 4D4]OEK01358.1 hypothetical protein BFP97_07440 [Roseivirga sp. 4D4]